MDKIFKYVKYSNSYKLQVLDLLGELWNFSKEDRAKYFLWKFENNPFAKKPMAYIALDGEKVVAFRGYLIQPFIINQKEFLIAALADTVTHPEYRRQGIFEKLTEYSLQELSLCNNILASTNSSSGGPTLNGYLKLGWQPLTERDNVSYFSPIQFIKQRMGLNKETIDINKVELKIGLIFEISPYFIPETFFIEIEGDRINDSSISHLFSHEFYQWRLGNPIAKYIYTYLWDSGRIKAYVILKQYQFGKFEIIDFKFYEKKYFEIILKQIKKQIKPIYLKMWIGGNNELVHNYLRYGFLPMKIVKKILFIKPTPPFLIRSTKLIQNEDSWFIEGVDMRFKRSWNLFKIIGDET
ncbi:MAG: GNAT family N-acetyltransferase [Mariniphaga sp.]